MCAVLDLTLINLWLLSRNLNKHATRNSIQPQNRCLGTADITGHMLERVLMKMESRGLWENRTYQHQGVNLSGGTCVASYICPNQRDCWVGRCWRPGGLFLLLHSLTSIASQAVLVQKCEMEKPRIIILSDIMNAMASHLTPPGA